MNKIYKVQMRWDNEAEVWTAISKDNLGLALEHASFDTLVYKVRLALPELLELQGLVCEEIDIELIASHREKVCSKHYHLYKL